MNSRTHEEAMNTSGAWLRRIGLLKVEPLAVFAARRQNRRGSEGVRL